MVRKLAIHLGLLTVLVLSNAIVAPGAPNVYLDNGRIHGGYSSNTDACASCHSPHNASGKELLQWATVNATCYACHDGTINSTYNVKAGRYNIRPVGHSLA